MIFRNSMKNLFRTRGKTALFFALIFILTLLIGLDGYVWLSITEYLATCDENFTTIGLFEYMGTEYPDETVYDPGVAAARDRLNALDIANRSGVLTWDSSKRALGYAEGFRRTDAGVYDKNLAVLVIRPSHLQDNGLYWAGIEETLYSSQDCTGIVLNVDANGLAELESGHRYLVAGRFFNGPSSYKYFRLEPFKNAAAGDAVCVDVTDPAARAGYILPKESVFYDIADTERIINNCLDVFACADIDAQYCFHQDQICISGGRAFSEEEYASGAKVCLVSEALLEQLGLRLGDTLPLSLMSSENAAVYDSFWSDGGFASSGEYRIVGSLTVPFAMKHYIYVPAGANPVFDKNAVGYTLGTVLLENGEGESFLSGIQQELPDRVRLTIYDQGYTALEKPFQQVLRVTGIAAVVCVLAGLSILALFGYLFVSRQRDVSVTMIRLGAGKRRVCAYFLYGAVLLALLAAGLGALAGYLVSDAVSALVSRAALSSSLADMRYSSAVMSVTKSLAFTPSGSALPFILAALAILLCALVFCYAFTVGTFRTKRARASAAPAQRLGERRRTLRAGGMKYMLLSIVRGGPRSVITPVTALIAAVFLCQLTASGDAYRADYELLFADTSITGSVTDIHGKNTGKLAISGATVNALLRSGYLEELAVSASDKHLYEGVTVSGGVRQEVAPIEFPTGDYAMETFIDRVMAGPSLVYTNSLEKAPEFYYSSVVRSQYLDGYDESVLASDLDSHGAVPCLVSSALCAEKGIMLGDTIRVWIYNANKGWGESSDLLVVGSFHKAGFKDNIYCPLSCFISKSMLELDESDPLYPKLRQYSFDSVAFTLGNAADLTVFKDYLEGCGFSGVANVNMKRVFIMLNDASFTETAQSLSRQLRLYPFLYALTGTVGLVAAYLLVLHRRREFAIMRVLGTPARRVFDSLFFEQALLCLPGAALGFAIHIFIGKANLNGALLIAGFCACWLCGSAAALMRMSRPSVLAIMHEEE